MIKGKTLTAIIPIYNESPHLKEVLNTIIKLKYMDEIIAINDGSQDDSLDILKKFSQKIKIITYKDNRGKGYAVAQGLKVAKGELIVLLDADILNYSNEQIEKLCIPVADRDLQFTIAIYDKRKELLIMKGLGGFRSYRKEDLVPFINELEKSTKYGIEPILNTRLKAKNENYILVPKIEHLCKYKRFHPTKAMREYMEEGKSLTKENLKILITPKQ